MGGYKTRQASGKFHHIIYLCFQDTPNLHLSQGNNERSKFPRKKANRQWLSVIRWNDLLPNAQAKMISSFLDRGIAFICASRIRALECVKPSC